GSHDVAATDGQSGHCPILGSSHSRVCIGGIRRVQTAPAFRTSSPGWVRVHRVRRLQTRLCTTRCARNSCDEPALACSIALAASCVVSHLAKAKVARSRSCAAAHFRNAARLAQLETLRKCWIVFGSCRATKWAEPVRTDKDS